MASEKIYPSLTTKDAYIEFDPREELLRESVENGFDFKPLEKKPQTASTVGVAPLSDLSTSMLDSYTPIVVGSFTLSQAYAQNANTNVVSINASKKATALSENQDVQDTQLPSKTGNPLSKSSVAPNSSRLAGASFISPVLTIRLLVVLFFSIPVIEFPV